MAKTAAAPAETAAGKGGGGKKKLVMIVVPVLLVLVAAWYFVLGPGSGSGEAEEKPKEVELGEVVALDPITMNLADGRLLKVGLALQLPLEPPELLVRQAQPREIGDVFHVGARQGGHGPMIAGPCRRRACARWARTTSSPPSWGTTVATGRPLRAKLVQ